MGQKNFLNQKEAESKTAMPCIWILMRELTPFV